MCKVNSHLSDINIILQLPIMLGEHQQWHTDKNNCNPAKDKENKQQCSSHPVCMSSLGISYIPIMPLCGCLHAHIAMGWIIMRQCLFSALPSLSLSVRHWHTHTHTHTHTRVRIPALILNLSGITAGMPAMFFQLMKEWRKTNRGAKLKEKKKGLREENTPREKRKYCRGRDECLSFNLYSSACFTWWVFLSQALKFGDFFISRSPKINLKLSTLRSIYIGTLTQFSPFWLCSPPQWP